MESSVNYFKMVFHGRSLKILDDTESKSQVTKILYRLGQENSRTLTQDIT